MVSHSFLGAFIALHQFGRAECSLLRLVVVVLLAFCSRFPMKALNIELQVNANELRLQPFWVVYSVSTYTVDAMGNDNAFILAASHREMSLSGTFTYKFAQCCCADTTSGWTVRTT